MEKTAVRFIQYLDEVKEMSANTIESYQRDLEKFILFLKEADILEFKNVNETLVNSYILDLEKQGFKSATVARNIVTLKAFFLYLIKQHLVEDDPMERIRPPKVIKHPPINLPLKEVERLLDSPDISTAAGKRDKAIFEVLYATGIKVSELIHLKVEDLNMQYNILSCMSAKKERVIPFGEKAKEALLLYLEEGREELLKGKTHNDLFVNRQGNAMTRQGLWKLIKRYAEEAGIEQVTPQSLRNSFAAHLIENGANVITVGEMLGYTDNSMAYIYAGAKNARVREEYVKAHPRT